MKKNPGPKEGSTPEEVLYSDADFKKVPVLAIELARGCGNPTGFGDIRLADTVVDLGCGGGIDVILAAKKVGPDGKVIGVDIAPNMIERARQAVEEAKLEGTGIELIVGDVERLTLGDDIADVVMSNCVMSMVPDKAVAYREAFRVLKPGGRLVIADLVQVAEIDPDVKARIEKAWQGALGGSVLESEYMHYVKSAGFTGIDLVSRDLLTPGEVKATSCCPGVKFAKPASKEDLKALEGKVASIKFTAVKP